MTNWEPQDRYTIGAADELDIEPRHDHGRAERATTIWVVRVDDDLYVRSYRGRDGRWFQQASEVGAGVVRAGGIERAVAFEACPDGDRDAIDTAYRTKYGKYGSTYVDPMVTDAAAATTLRLVPR